jgi:molybdate transport system ATP-binding protein
VGEPRVLVLDEFTNGLDRAARHEVLTALERVAALTTLVIASHRADDFPALITHTATVDAGIVVSRAGRPAAAPAPESVPPPMTSRAVHDPHVLLRFRNADVYRGDTLVLRDVDWELRQGEHTLVRGKNGAGKSTFAGLIAGTISAATGAAIERFGQTGPFDIWRLKERVAHVSDDLQIAYDRADIVEAVIASGFTASIGLFVEPTASQRAAVAELIDRIGIDALRGRSLRQLSFGERRKVLIARSLVRRPAILILDEVWNGLDVAFRTRLRSLLDELADGGTTLVAIAHEDDGDITALTPRVCEIDGGQVREVTSAALLGQLPTKTM